MVGNMRESLKKMDKPLFISIIILCVIGLVMVFSASSVSAVLQYKVEPYYFFKKQLIVMLIGIFIGLAFLIRFPIKKYIKLKTLIMLSIIGSLLGLFFYGTVTNSARSWYDLGLFSLQPSEFAKSAVIIYMACFFGKNINSTKRFYFLRPIIASALVAGLIFTQPDLGTAAIIGLIVFFMFLVVPFPKKDKDAKIFKRLGAVAIILMVLVMVFGGEFLNKEQVKELWLISKLYDIPVITYGLKTNFLGELFQGSKALIEKALIELTDGAYIIAEDTNFYSKETGLSYDVNKTVRDTDLKNGSRIILL